MLGLSELSATDAPDLRSSPLIYGAFSFSPLFNSDISFWDVSQVTDIGGIFFEADAFNQDLSNWDVSSVTDMTEMFTETAFDQDLSSWQVLNVKSMKRMLDGTTLSTENYDAMLISWSQQEVQRNVVLDAGSNVHSAAAYAAVDILRGKGWTINDATPPR